MLRILLLYPFVLINLLSAQPQYVTTIHPFKEILSEIIGTRGSIEKILPAGASPHTYELKPSLIQRIESAKALFLGAQNLDKWAFNLKNNNRIELINFIPDSNLIYIRNHNDKVMGVDPHFWTDPIIVKNISEAIMDTLCKLDPEGCLIYQRNRRNFSRQLKNLGKSISDQLMPLKGKNVILSHPFFQYFLSRFKIRLSAIIETSPGIEPTLKEIKWLIEKVKHDKVEVILTHGQHSDRPAQIIAEATGVKICVLDPLGGVEGRHSYEEILLYNTQKIMDVFK
jgi:zinc transport system substrate-binding protein